MICVEMRKDLFVATKMVWKNECLQKIGTHLYITDGKCRLVVAEMHIHQSEFQRTRTWDSLNNQTIPSKLSVLINRLKSIQLKMLFRTYLLSCIVLVPRT